MSRCKFAANSHLPGCVMIVVALWAFAGQPIALDAQDAETQLTTAELEFFETRIRPVLVESCYECHNTADFAEGDFVVDHRQAMLAGGVSGRMIVPGKPQESRLLAILRHEVEGLEMPEGAPQLDAEVIADFEKWIAMGAPDPRDAPPSEEEVATATSWPTLLERRKQWWSLQPIQPQTPPARQTGDRQTGDSPTHPIDRFIQARLDEAGLQPAPLAPPAVLVRRLYFTLLGLPPSPSEARQWTELLQQATVHDRQAVVENLTDELLADPRFGERWARHWMDWLRYAESHGSEGDPDIIGADHYRDYLVRAMNHGVPFDQLIREHIAGDLLKEPRVNQSLGINESVIGTAHWRMVFHGFAPTDALDEKVRFVDDQINVASKAFLGLTVSCARCHNHKFDAISQADYYAWFGILSSCRPGRNVMELPERLTESKDELADLKRQIRQAVAEDWLREADSWPTRITQLVQSEEEIPGLLQPLRRVANEVDGGADFQQAWEQELKLLRRFADKSEPPSLRRWDLADGEDHQEWYRAGIGLHDQPQRSGEFAVAPAGEAALVGIYPAGVFSHAISQKYPARFTSPDFELTEDSTLWVRVIGDANAKLRYVVRDYPRSGTVYPVTALNNEWRWQRYDLSYWTGDTIHVELSTAADAPLLVNERERSWFGVREVLLTPKGHPGPPRGAEGLLALLGEIDKRKPTNVEQLSKAYADVLTEAIEDWRAERLNDGQAALLDSGVRQGWLANRLDTLPTARPLVERYRECEAAIPVPTRVPGLDESKGEDHPLFVRGDHRQPGADVPRRFLEAIDATPYETRQSGRLELARDLLRDDNPLTRRVLVNRVWHHLFGQGIVTTPDNFGRLGDEPSHPQLLDWLALEFAEKGWSLKPLIRLVVTSETWQQASQPSTAAEQIDPENRLLSHAEVRRLEAEAIRDAILSMAGKLEVGPPGTSVRGDAPFRSLYVKVKRNQLDPFLRAFDFPEPFSSVGRRSVTNVPAQSLMLLNSPQVASYAADWADRILALPVDESLEQADREQARIEAMFWMALGRAPQSQEVKLCSRFLAETRQRLEAERKRWAELDRKEEELKRRQASLLEPVRKRLLAERGKTADSLEAFLPEPMSRWDFTQSLKDQVGKLHVQLRGPARQTERGLVLGNNGFGVTPPLQKSVQARTLEAWVQLDNLSQRAGGVISLQSRNGSVFDAIVFGEQEPGKWLSGSDFFRRTQAFQGPVETDAQQRPVHVAIVYASDGSVTAYRDGVRYGQSYRADGPVTHAARESLVTFGLRHLPAGGNKHLAGTLLQARLYDRALTEAEISASFKSDQDFVPQQLVEEQLTPAERDRLATWQGELQTIEAERAAAGDVPQEVHQAAVWRELALAMLTFKEFIYVR